MTDSHQLLRAYVIRNSEEAFRRLVERHIPLVYSAALRIVHGDAALASDVTQMVFADLARKAPSLPANVLLPGWLYRHTTFTAAKVLRGESRRRVREREAAVMNAPNDDGDSEHLWNQLRPVLDEAIACLSARDRNAVVMRFFDQQDFRSLATNLNLSEDAAQKRVTRALEKLRQHFQKRGISASTTALAGAIAAHGVTAAPASLGALVAGNALVHTGSAAGPILFSLLMTKIKTITVSAVVIAAVTTPLYLQHQSIARLRSENERLTQQIAAQAEAAPAITAVEAATSEADARELLQLRSEVGRLRREQAKIASLEAGNKRLPAQPIAEPPKPMPQEPLPSESWADRGFASPLDTLQTAHWAVRTGNVEKFRQSLFITDEARRKFHDLIAKMAANAPPGEALPVLEEIKNRGWDAEEGLLFPMMAQDRKHGYKSYRVLSQSAPQPDELNIDVQLEMNTAPAQTRQLRFKQFGSVWKQIIDVADLPPEARN